MLAHIIGGVSGCSGCHFDDFLIVKSIAQFVGQNLSKFAATAAILSANGNDRDIIRIVGSRCGLIDLSFGCLVIFRE